VAAGLGACLWLQRLQAEIGAGMAHVLGVGLFMLAYGAAVGWLAGWPRLPLALQWAVPIGNAVWVLASVLLAVSDWITPTPLGLVLLLGQAAVVGALAVMQAWGVLRPMPVSAT